jgi:hypothetical protein
LVRVSVCVAIAPISRLPKLSDDAEIVNPGIPVPVSEAVRVLADETTVSVPVRAPSADGVNTTLIWQLAPPGTEAQLFEATLKSPLAEAKVICEAKLELLVQVKAMGAVVKPTGSDPKSCVVGASDGCPPSSVSSKSMYSSSFSCGVIDPVVHSLGKDVLGELLPFSTWYSLNKTRPH